MSDLYHGGKTHQSDYSGPSPLQTYVANLAAERDELRSALAWVRDFAESQSPYHSGFKHIVRYIDASEEAT